MTSPDTELSGCCHAPMIVVGDSFGEGTNHYECTKCSSACDRAVIEPQNMQEKFASDIDVTRNREVELRDMNEWYSRFVKETDVIKKFNLFIEWYCPDNYAHLIDSDDNPGQEMRNAIYKYALQRLREAEIAAGQRQVGDAIEINVSLETMQFVLSKIKMKPKTIAQRLLMNEMQVNAWIDGTADKFDLQVYIWQLKILASLTHKYNWAIFLLKPDHLPTSKAKLIKKHEEQR